MAIKTLLISPVPTHPQDAGNRIRVFQLAEQLRAEGCDLHFAYYDHENAGGDFKGMQRYWGKKGIFLSERNPRVFSLTQRIIGRSLQNYKKSGDQEEFHADNVVLKPLTVDVWNNRQFDNILSKLHYSLHFQMVWVEYVFLSGILNRFDSSVVKVIDTHDIFTDRQEMFAANQVDPEWFFTNQDMEKKGLRRADYVIAIKDEDARFFKSFGLPKVRTIGHFFPAQPDHEHHKREANVLFIGSDNMSNVKAWEYFKDKMLDQVMERIPQATIHVAGRICQRIQDSPFYRKLGLISELKEIYNSVKVAINPVTFGTGLKIKSIEPLAFGCPVVTTPVGIEGIEEAKNKGILVGETPEDFVAHLESLLTNPSIYKEQRDQGYRFFCHYQAQNKRQLKNLLAEIKNRIHNFVEG